jgi:hypothetical protein
MLGLVFDVEWVVFSILNHFGCCKVSSSHFSPSLSSSFHSTVAFSALGLEMRARSHSYGTYGEVESEVVPT